MRYSALFSMLSLVGLLGQAACLEPSSYQYGFNVTGREFVLFSDQVGIHPSLDVLRDPNNYFREYGVSNDMKWEILASGGNVAAFYAFATLLAREPTGENQFYVGTTLQSLYELGEADEGDLPAIRALALRAYQNVLDAFPESVTYDASGTRPSRLATFAFQRILDLGGRVQGDWVLVETASGAREAVRSAPTDPARSEEGAGS